MKCNEVQQNLPGYCEGSLSASVTEEISGHLSHCEVCAAEESSYRKTWDLLDSWDGIEPHNLYRARFWQKEAERSGGILSHLIPRLRPALVATICVAFLLISAVLFISLKNNDGDLFTASLKPWRPLDHMTFNRSVYSIALVDEDDRLLARAHTIITVPDYLEDTVHNESSLYPDLPLGDTGVHVMEGSQRVIMDMVEGAL